MKWSTEVPVRQGEPLIGYEQPVVLLGSCFAAHLGAKLAHFQFQQLTNPLGILYHPKAIETVIDRSLAGHSYVKDDFFKNQDLWRNFEAHSDLAGPDLNKTITLHNEALQALCEDLGRASHIVITLGTALAYQLLSSGDWVGNCQKMPASLFEKQLMDPGQLEESLFRALSKIREVNPGVHFLMTVSPVRHIRDGLVENQRSKAHLLAAVHKLADSGLVQYFPAYEIMMDELRDYRFYEPDLVHPNAMAIDYIWERFKASWIDPELNPVLEEVDRIRKGLAHRPLHPDSDAHRNFRQKLEGQIKELAGRYPFMDFS
ncbi:GSCFA domain-containing protein [Robiginitalea sp. IMCC44478]|uniref:GSCFA domain-containing protein n=1 Tax=Robiginitalea sp. IMCC44478 TaxID=3459122 RepID=UPI0040417805